MPSSSARSTSVKPENAFLYAFSTSSERSVAACSRKPSVSASDMTMLRFTPLARAILFALVSESEGSVKVVRCFLALFRERAGPMDTVCIRMGIKVYQLLRRRSMTPAGEK